MSFRGPCLVPTGEHFKRKRQYRAPSSKAGMAAGSLRSDCLAMCYLAHGVFLFFLEIDLVVVRLGLFHMEVWISGFFQVKRYSSRAEYGCPPESGQYSPFYPRP